MEEKLKKLADDARVRAEGIEVNVGVGDRTTKATVHPNPLMKYTDVPRRIEMATLWVWEEDGRPVALGKVEAYERKEGTKWLYCFASASTGLVDSKWPDGRRFQARKPGLDWSAIKGPVPQETAGRQFAHLRFADDDGQTGIATRHGMTDPIPLAGIEKQHLVRFRYGLAPP